jgi:hypothetical protein
VADTLADDEMSGREIHVTPTEPTDFTGTKAGIGRE